MVTSGWRKLSCALIMGSESHLCAWAWIPSPCPGAGCLQSPARITPARNRRLATDFTQPTLGALPLEPFVNSSVVWSLLKIGHHIWIIFWCPLTHAYTHIINVCSLKVANKKLNYYFMFLRKLMHYFLKVANKKLNYYFLYVFKKADACFNTYSIFRCRFTVNIIIPAPSFHS